MRFNSNGSCQFKSSVDFFVKLSSFLQPKAIFCVQSFHEVSMLQTKNQFDYDRPEDEVQVGARLYT